MAAFEPSGVITLTTDFGLEDPFVGVMKGQILSRFAAARIIDLTHGVPAQRPEEAAVWLARSFEYFPRGPVHVAVVDPGVGTARAIVCLITAGHALLAPDNGLLEPVAAGRPDAHAVRLAPSRLAALGAARVSATFHGRDLFAPVAAELASGRCTPESLGEPAALTPGTMRGPRVSEEGVEGSILTVDHFGNLITNIDGRMLAGLAEPRIRIAGHVLALRRTYGDARPGELLALVNSFDLLEIACSQGSAARVLGVGRGAPVTASSAKS